MPTKYTGRLLVIALVTVACLILIFPKALVDPKTFFDPNVPWGEKLNLKPGIDMVGGTSLLYEIKPPDERTSTSGLAEKVMQALRIRVDKQGTKNLVWRPQGDTRLEIQMPMTAGRKKAEVVKKAKIEAGNALEETNVSPGEVVAAVEAKDATPEVRAAKLKELAKGDPGREALFRSLAEAYDSLRAAVAAKDAKLTSELREAYGKLKEQIESTNLRPDNFDMVLGLKSEAERAEKLAELRADAADYPARREALERYAAVYDEYDKVRDLVDDVTGLKRELRGAGVLQFNIAADDAPPQMQIEMEQRLKTRGPKSVAGDQLKWFEVDRREDYKDRPLAEYNGKYYILGWNEPSVAASDEDPSVRPRAMDHREGTTPWALKGAEAISLGMTGEQVVEFTFDAQGGSYFSRLTGANVGKWLMAVLDGKVRSLAVIKSRIGDTGTISGGGHGGFEPEELTYLVKTLKAGSMPAQLADEPISERTIGPQLGEDNLRRGFAACVFGLVVVAVFLIGYYYLSGVVAMIAVLLNMVIILGIMAAMGATFTLPGVAGIVLTIGMAVDANVLIFERLREEQTRGLSLRMALRNAYDRAWSAILDGNVTTGITALCLYAFGSEEVRGFGLTLLIGILSSLFTALFVTKTVFGLLIDRFGVQSLGSLPLTFPRWDRALRPNIDWMSKAWAFMAFSALFIVAGLALFGVRLYQGRVMDVEFTKGTSIQFELRQPTPIKEVRDLIGAQAARTPDALPTPSVVSVGGTGDTTYEIITPNDDSRAVRQAVLDALGGRLKLELPSTFTGLDRPLDAALDDNLIVPIRSATDLVAGFAPKKLPSHVGGAALVLKDLNPRLTPAEVKDRIERQRLQSQGGHVAFDVEADPAGSGTVVVMTSNPSFLYEAQDALKRDQWAREVAGPMWETIKLAVNKPAELQKISNFDAQVAGETQREALLALALSIIGIMAYIWARFGNLRYGSATVIALVHDTLFCLAAVGFAHYLAEVPFLAKGLLLEPFRVNLTLVAAVLTVMGYSMNDTVVIFDRIRENRGRFGVVNPKVINDSINQTLSRTLLTGGTTILTIFVMYIFGGPGIHGFTFVLLIGILVGTYSSIAIASPFLLLGRLRQQQEYAAPSRSVGQLQQAGA